MTLSSAIITRRYIDMALNAKTAPRSTGGGTPQEPIEPGTYPARLVRVIDLGLQPQRPYMGKDKPPIATMMVTYEFLDEFCLDEDGKELLDKPRWLSEDFPLHNIEADLAKSTKRYLALDPEFKFDGDWAKMLDVACMVTVTNKVGTGKNVGKVFTNVSNVSAMRAKQEATAPALVNPPSVLLLDEPDLEVFGNLPGWIQEKITKHNLEYAGSPLQIALTQTTTEPQPTTPEEAADEQASEPEEAGEPAETTDTEW